MPFRRPEERIGTLMAGRYRLDRIIGQGGMGLVYAGTHSYTGQKVAIKVLLPRLVESPSILKRFFQEAKAAASLDHPNVVHVFDSGEDESGDAYITMELLEGESLAERLERGLLDAGEALNITLPIVDALRVAHEGGIVHRDLKPENVFLQEVEGGPPLPKLLDFGVAKLLQRQKNYTQTGMIMGTPYFLSPEQAGSGAEISVATDVWAVGVLLLSSIGGVRPFQDEDPARMMVRVATTDLAPVRELADGIPEGLGRVIDGCLARDPADRLDCMKDVGRALVLAARTDGVEISAPPPDLVPLADQKLPTPRSNPAPDMPLNAVPQDAPGPPAQPSAARWKWGGLGVALAALVMIGVLAWGQDASTSPIGGGEASVPASVTRRLETIPPGATAVVNGADAGITPIDILVPGDESVPVRVVRRGFYPQEVYVAPTDPAVIRVELRPTRIEAGAVVDTYERTVSSTPSGAAVTVRGQPRGYTPVVLVVDPERSVPVELTLPGYWPSSIFLSVSDPPTVEVTLNPRN